MMFALLAVVVFVGAMILDYATVRYQRAVNEATEPAAPETAAKRAAHRAARWSVTMYAIGAIGFLSVIRVSPWLMLPEILGLYVGTLLAVRR